MQNHRKSKKSWLYGGVALFWSTVAWAQQGVEVSIAGISGVTNFAAARADTSFLLLTFTEIPFGGEWLFALAGLAYGVYALYRRQ